MERKHNRTKKTKTPYFGNPDMKPAKKNTGNGLMVTAASHKNALIETD